MAFLHETMVEQAIDAVTENYCNMYCGVVERPEGSKNLVISSVNKLRITKFVEYIFVKCMERWYFGSVSSNWSETMEYTKQKNGF